MTARELSQGTVLARIQRIGKLSMSVIFFFELLGLTYDNSTRKKRALLLGKKFVDSLK
jgi:hypothetical protein